MLNCYTIDTAGIVCGRVYVTTQCPSGCLSVCLSVCVSVCPSARLSVCLSVCLCVCPSVRPSVLSYAAATACGGFAAEGSAGRRYQSIAARRICSRRGRLSIHIQSSTALSSKCAQCHVYSDVGSWKRTRCFYFPTNSAS